MVIIRSPPPTKRAIVRAPAPVDDAPFEWAPLGSEGPTSRTPQRFPALPAAAAPTRTDPPASAATKRPLIHPGHTHMERAPSAGALDPRPSPHPTDGQPPPTLAHQPLQPDKDRADDVRPPPPRHVDPRPLPTLARHSPAMGERERLPSLGSIAALNRAKDPVQEWHVRASPERAGGGVGADTPATCSKSVRVLSSASTPQTRRTPALSAPVPDPPTTAAASNKVRHEPQAARAPSQDAGTEDTSIVIHPDESLGNPTPHGVPSRIQPPTNMTPLTGTPSARRTPGTAHRLEPSARAARIDAHELAGLRRRVVALETEIKELRLARDQRNQLKEECEGWESEVARYEAELSAASASARKARGQHAVALSASRMTNAHTTIRALAAADDAREADIARVGAENRATYVQARLDEAYMVLEAERAETAQEVARVRAEARAAVKAERSKAKKSTAHAQESREHELAEQVDQLADQLDSVQQAGNHWQRKAEANQTKLEELSRQIKKLKADATARKGTYHGSDGPRFIDSTSSPARPLDWRPGTGAPEDEDDGGGSAVEPDVTSDSPPAKKPSAAARTRTTKQAKVAPNATSKAQRGKKRPSLEPEDEEQEENPRSRGRPGGSSARAGPKAAKGSKRGTKAQSATELAAEAFAIEAEKSVVLPRARTMQERDPPPQVADVDPLPDPDEPKAVPSLGGKKKRRRLLGNAALGSQFLSSAPDTAPSSLLPLELSPVKPTSKGKGGAAGLSIFG